MTYKDQLEILEADVNHLPDDLNTKGVWKSLVHVLTSWNDKVDEITEMKGQIKVIQSDIRETKNMVSKLSGNGEIKFDENSHPNRRKSDTPDERGEADKLLDWVKREIIPGIVRRFIDTLVIIVIVLAILHWTEIINLAP